MDGRGWLSWWALIVGHVVAERARSGRGGGCGIEKEAVSQFVMCLTLDQHFKRTHARDHAHAQIVVYINCTVL